MAHKSNKTSYPPKKGHPGKTSKKGPAKKGAKPAWTPPWLKKGK